MACAIYLYCPSMQIGTPTLTLTPTPTPILFVLSKLFPINNRFRRYDSYVARPSFSALRPFSSYPSPRLTQLFVVHLLLPPTSNPARTVNFTHYVVAAIN